MGNAQSSVEGSENGPEKGPDKVRRTTQKLTKPRTGSYAAAGLLNPNGSVDSRRRLSTTRTYSRPYGTSPASSPMLHPSENGSTTGQVHLDEPTEPDSTGRLTRNLFRSLSQLSRRRSRSRKDSIGDKPIPESTRPSRASSVSYAAPESSYYIQAGNLNWSATVSRVSANYDLTSYEGKRLLNLAEESLHEDNSIMSESQFEVIKPRRKSMISQAPAELPPAVAIARVNSDLSLYSTPMRRRSLLQTPGVATRAPPVPALTPRMKARYSLPSTPARRDSFDGFDAFEASMQSLALPASDPDSIPRAATPCEEPYQQMGAFKLGSLRITNGSPARSPALDHNQSKHEARQIDDYFIPQKEANHVGPETKTTTSDIVTDKTKVQKSPVHSSLAFNTSPCRGSEGSPSVFEAPKSTFPTSAFPKFLPEIQLSPLSLEGSEAGTSELQTTSKHTAAEDELFEVESPDSPQFEVLDVRVDLSAKSLPPRPRLISEDRGSHEIRRTDSGLVPSPISEYSHKALAKADSGYSSNVSLRSFSAKPSIAEKRRSPVAGIEIPPKTPPKDPFATTYSSPTVVATPATTVSRPVINAPAPPVPEKDQPSLVRPRALTEVPQTARQHFWPRHQVSWSKNSRNVPSPISSRFQDSAKPTQGTSPLSPTSPAASLSALSIGSRVRKPGKLQRLLSGATRKPLPLHETHSPGHRDIPAVSEEVQAKFSQHTGLFPLPSMRSALKPEPSQETLGTIVSVGSSEIPLGKDVPPLPTLADDESEEGGKAQRQEHTLKHQKVFRSASAASPISSARKSIIRKPVPIRQLSDGGFHLIASGTVDHALGTRGPSLDLVRKSLEAGAFDATFSAMANERESSLTIPSSVARSNTMTAQVERESETRYAASDEPEVQPSPAVASCTSLEPPAAAAHIRKPRTPPPVSMRTRNMGSVRVPPPPRPQSTPPNAVQPCALPALSRKTSRESIYSYPAVSGSAPISRQTSRENIYSYLPVQQQYHARERSMTAPPPPAPPMNPRRSLSFMTEKGEHRRPIWEVQTDHGGSTSQTSSVSQTYNSSLSFQPGQPVAIMLKPRTSREWQAPIVPTLRQRVSYDDYSNILVQEEAQSFYQDNGPYPSMPRADGNVYVSDPWSGRPMPQQWDQYGRPPLQVPRGHQRNGCLDQFGNPAPFRVLHSYNSPAYKNVPIWG
ncbi:uncharacterized protein BCR38DRAFT_407283 [Pseudomassariella vexata]|uniref:Proteophosphoglycan ppg4 n=1 Tax=Pseudomassariella vexata TaxID=1141098 RepID=A0A1Y2E7J6_9PEZI|nr:uncharacterized protein BCR38DRAFT_407283 [Pseudomassariella vexata]ORY67294.1 hypothetical protein BCR38DRAFT_407283 [Pseudomassariella vexata]